MLLLNSSEKFQPELASIGNKAVSRWRRSEMPNIFLLRYVGRQSGFWTSPSPAKTTWAVWHCEDMPSTRSPNPNDH